MYPIDQLNKHFATHTWRILLHFKVTKMCKTKIIIKSCCFNTLNLLTRKCFTPIIKKYKMKYVESTSMTYNQTTRLKQNIKSKYSDTILQKPRTLVCTLCSKLREANRFFKD